MVRLSVFASFKKMFQILNSYINLASTILSFLLQSATRSVSLNENENNETENENENNMTE